MEILGIGASELIFILLIAIIALGPKDMQKAGRTIGRWLNQLRQSDGWKVFQDTSREIRNIPNRLMREANLDELDKNLRTTLNPRPNPPASPARRSPSIELRTSLPQSEEVEHSTQSEPPATKPSADDGVVSPSDNNG